MSVSFGSSAVFRWRRQSCPDDDGHLCWLGHGDILVMDVQCQDEFLHCTGSGLDQERIRSVGLHNMLLPVVVCQRVRRVHQFLIRGIWEMAVFALSCFSLVPCAFWVY